MNFVDEVLAMADERDVTDARRGVGMHEENLLAGAGGQVRNGYISLLALRG